MEIKKEELYYQKLIDIINNLYFYKPIKSLSNKFVNNKEAIKSVLDNNLEYLLTDGFLYFLIANSLGIDKVNFRNVLNLSLNSLNDINKLYSFYVEYIDYIGFPSLNFKQKYHFYNYDLSYKPIVINKMLSNDEKKVYSNYELFITRICTDRRFGNKEYIILKKIFQIIASFTLINKRVEEYNSFVEPYIINYEKKFEELEMNGLFIDRGYLTFRDYGYLLNDNDLISYIVNSLDNKEKKLIR